MCNYFPNCIFTQEENYHINKYATAIWAGQRATEHHSLLQSALSFSESSTDMKDMEVPSLVNLQTQNSHKNSIEIFTIKFKKCEKGKTSHFFLPQLSSPSNVPSWIAVGQLLAAPNQQLKLKKESTQKLQQKAPFSFL